MRQAGLHRVEILPSTGVNAFVICNCYVANAVAFVVGHLALRTHRVAESVLQKRWWRQVQIAGVNSVLAEFTLFGRPVLRAVPAINKLHITILSVAVHWINCPNHALAPRVRVVEVDCNVFRRLPVGAGIED